VLMTGRTPGSERLQPLTWTREHQGGRVFYTSLGGVEDFQNRAFARMVANALFWTAGRPVARKEMPPRPPRLRKEGVLKLSMRTRVASKAKGEDWRAENVTREWPAAETAVVVCDMWDKHWCDFASKRVDEMAPRVNELLNAVRASGVQIIHCPSETLGFYQGAMARRRMQSAPPTEPAAVKKVTEPGLPIDDSDGGCPGQENSYLAWTRQHAAIEIKEEDGVSDNGREIYNYLHQEGINNILYVGVHTNMCVLGRTFGIRQMTRWGMNCALVRDLTDTMYNPEMPPKVPHDEGTDLVVQHIEKHWCPSLLSSDVLSGLPPSSH